MRRFTEEVSAAAGAALNDLQAYVNARLGLEPTVETSAWNVGSSTGRGLSVDDQKIAALFAVARDSQ